MMIWIGPGKRWFEYYTAPVNWRVYQLSYMNITSIALSTQSLGGELEGEQGYTVEAFHPNKKC